MMTHTYGSILARRRSSWSAAASETGVISGKVTKMTCVYAGSLEPHKGCYNPTYALAAG